MTNLKILICGTGSIGKRHTRNLRTLGVQELAVFDPIEEERNAITEEVGCKGYGDYTEALEQMQPDVVFICSPTKFHVDQAMAAANAGANLFIEKPLNHTVEGVEELKNLVEAKGLTCMVGCNMRFHFGPSTVKKVLDAGTIGEVTDAYINVLFDFTGRADLKGNVERIRATYNADPAQGGAIRECVHEIDLSLWYFGEGALNNATKINADRIGIPEVEGESSLYIDHANGAKSHVHLSFMNPEYKRGCKITGTKGAIEWDFTEGIVKVTDAEGNETAAHTAEEGYEVNQMYLDEISYFFECMENGTKPMGNLDDATLALKMALDAVETAEEQLSVPA